MTPTSVQNWVRTGRLPSIKIGGVRFIPRAACETLQAHRRGTRDFLRIREAAAALGVSYGTIRNWANQGLFTISKVGAECHVPRTEVEALLQRLRGEVEVMKTDEEGTIAVE